MRLKVLYCVWILCDKKIHEVKVSFQDCQVVRFSGKVDPYIVESDLQDTKGIFGIFLQKKMILNINRNIFLKRSGF